MEKAADEPVFAGVTVRDAILGQFFYVRLILGAAYSYKDYVKNPRVCVPLIAFADAHSAPMQRFYNLLCIGYGADPPLFSDLVKKGYLPQSRADNCRTEYNEMNFAFHQVIGPHLDPQLAKAVLNRTWLPPLTSEPPPPGSLRHSPLPLEALQNGCSN